MRTADNTKGLKLGAIGFVASMVIGVASTAPAYSLAATLGLTAQQVGTRAPVVMLAAFVPMLFTAYGFKALNQDEPDCGTSFTWVARTLGRRTGWVTGWVVVVADVIVMANLAQIAGQYTFDLFGLTDLAGDRLATTVAGCVWIIVMTLIAYLGIELSARTQVLLLGLELAVLLVFCAVALVKVYTNTAGPTAIRPELGWFDPFSGGITIGQFSAGFLLAVFIYWGWDSALSINEETHDSARTPGRVAVFSTIVLLVMFALVTVSAQAYAGVSTTGIGLANPANAADSLSGLGTMVLGSWGSKALLLAVLSSAAASAQTTILPTARTTLAMAAYRALPKAFGEVDSRHMTPTVSTWAMGIVSVVFYAGLTALSPRALADLIASMGLLIAFYYGLTALAASWRFRRQLKAGPRRALEHVVIPALGALMLFGAFVRTAMDSAAVEFGATSLAGLGGVFLLGVGSILVGVVIMLGYERIAPAYFREPLPRGLTKTHETVEARLSVLAE